MAVPILVLLRASGFCLFFFNDTATTEIYTLSLHDALPISRARRRARYCPARALSRVAEVRGGTAGHERGDHPGASLGSNRRDRKSTRLNSSHLVISYAVFCLKKKKNLEAKTIL